MTTASHIATGFVIGITYTKLTNNVIDDSTLILISLLSSILPDINVIWHKPLLKHHQSFTHYPIFWFILLLPITIYNTFISIVPNEIIHIVILNIITHHVLDTFALRSGIHWLYPFSSKEFSITKIMKIDKKKISFKESLKLANKNKLIWIELSILIITVIITYALANYVS